MEHISSAGQSKTERRQKKHISIKGQSKYIYFVQDNALKNVCKMAAILSASMFDCEFIMYGWNVPMGFIIIASNIMMLHLMVLGL